MRWQNPSAYYAFYRRVRIKLEGKKVENEEVGI